MLDGDYAPRGKRTAVTRALDVVDNRCLGVAGAQEVGVQRVRLARAVDRALRRRQRLAKHLAAEDETCADVAALTAKQVVFQLFRLQQLDQFGNVVLRHGAALVRRTNRQV